MTVTANELAEYEFSQRMCGQHGRGVNKSIDVLVKHKRIIYKVKSNKKEILSTNSLSSAVDKYNDA